MSALTSRQIIITPEATLVIGGDADGCYVHIKASGENAVYIGDSDVSTESGYELEKDDALTIFLGPHERLYAIVEEGTGKLYFLASMNQ